MGRWELLGERYGLERSRIGTSGAAGTVAQEVETIYISQVCVGVWAVLWGGVGAAGRG